MSGSIGPNESCGDNGCCRLDSGDHAANGADTAADVPERRQPLRSYRIDGMDCSSCAMTIENHLKTFPGWLTLWIAVLSDTGAALLVILNSMRLLTTGSKRLG
jgi:hypothetical protein